MIRYLTIVNIALIRQLTLQFHDGMHVLTGETGAGKSIVIDSLNLVLGGRADRDLIRTGEEKASVEAAFDVVGMDDVTSFLEKEQIDADGSTVTLYREISVSGRNVCRINGVPVPVSTVREISCMLLDIHGQHEHQFLMDPDRHLNFLDDLGGDEHAALMDRVRIASDVFLANHRAYAALVRRNDRKEQRMKELQEDLTLLHSVDLGNETEEDLKEQYDQARFAGKIEEGLKTAKDELSVGELERSILSGMNTAVTALRNIAGYGKDLNELAERCQSAYYELQELELDLGSAISRSAFDPVKMEKTEKKLENFRKIKRKFGTDETTIVRTREELEAEYDELKDLDGTMADMAREHKRLLSEYRSLARELTAARKSLALSFEQKITSELHDLGMEHAVFTVRFVDQSGGKPLLPTGKGDDKLEFMIAPNPGEDPKPLAKIASGGELSRMMLAIKSLEARHHGTGTMVFDEIDTGISGRIAQTVAEKMASIAKERQVISVTHLPQIAAIADHQYLVRKSVNGDRTETTVCELDTEGRVSTIASMIGGGSATGEDAAAYARSLLKKS